MITTRAPDGANKNDKLNKNADIIAAAQLLIFPTKKMLLI